MAERDIYTKLQQNILLRDEPFKQEMEVVYFLVELRKFMDHNNLGRNDGYKIIRFYCDWAVHIDKRHRLDYIQDILARLYASCKETIESNFRKNHLYELDNFLRLTDLRKSFRTFFTEHELDPYMLDNDACWYSFIRLLLAILQDQPIVGGGSADIKEIKIRSVGDKLAQLDVEFNAYISNGRGEDLPSVGIIAGFE